MTASHSLLLGDFVEHHIDHEPPVLLVNSGQLGYLLLIVAEDLKIITNPYLGQHSKSFNFHFLAAFWHVGLFTGCLFVYHF